MSPDLGMLLCPKMDIVAFIKQSNSEQNANTINKNKNDNNNNENSNQSSSKIIYGRINSLICDLRDSEDSKISLYVNPFERVYSIPNQRQCLANFLISCCHRRIYTLNTNSYLLLNVTDIRSLCQMTRIQVAGVRNPLFVLHIKGSTFYEPLYIGFLASK